MIEKIDNILNRMDSIQKNMKNFQNYKPEPVKDFENMFREMVNTNNNKLNNESDKESIHPIFRKKKTNKNIKTKPVTDYDKINDAVSKSGKKYKISEDLINAVIRTESNYKKNAVSHAGAMGLMQLMPKTALQLGVNKPFDIYQNIEGGTHYLRMMLDRYDNNLEKALAAYNAGPHNVDAANGIPDIKETKNYVKKVLNIILK